MSASVLVGGAVLLYAECYTEITGRAIESSEDLVSITIKINEHLDSCFLCGILQASVLKERICLAKREMKELLIRQAVHHIFRKNN